MEKREMNSWEFIPHPIVISNDCEKSSKRSLRHTAVQDDGGEVRRPLEMSKELYRSSGWVERKKYYAKLHLNSSKPFTNL